MKAGKAQRALALPLRYDDMHKLRLSRCLLADIGEVACWASFVEGGRLLSWSVELSLASALSERFLCLVGEVKTSQRLE